MKHLNFIYIERFEIKIFLNYKCSCPGRGYTQNRHSRIQKEFINPLPLVGDQFGGSFCTQTASIRETAEPHYGGKNCY